MNRPHFKKSIADLEQLASESTDSEALHALLHELSHRTSRRARKLASDIHARVAQIGGRAQGSQDSVVTPNELRLSPAETSSGSECDTVPFEPPLLDLDALYRSFTPNPDDDVAQRIACWTALETLSTKTFRKPEDLAGRDRRRVASLGTTLPWEVGESSRRGYQLYYEVIVGTVDMDRATAALVDAFGRDEGRERPQRTQGCLASLMLDRNGRLLEEDGVVVSSFGWALPRVLEQRLDVLHAWPSVEAKVVQTLQAELVAQEADGDVLPLTMDRIVEVFDWLVVQFKLPSTLVTVPRFAIRHYHYYKAPKPPSGLLLNSFFVDDLTEAAQRLERGQLGHAALQYLGKRRPETSIDLLRDNTELEKVLAPSNMPLGRWPSGADRSLVLLQQAAVNVAAQIEPDGGLAAVNGPPGTGKTTLLRDVIANVVVDRAENLADFEDPNEAFRPSGTKVRAGDKGFWQVYDLDASIQGFEVLVASENNGAVENVSRELPGVKAVADDSIAYFRTVSDALASASVEGGTSVATWGLMAAVLGNMKNRADFQSAFWWDEDAALRLYLKAAKGDEVVREIKDDKGDVIERKTPAVVVNEQAPGSKAEARKRYARARRAFVTLKDQVAAELATVEEYRRNCLRLAEARRRESEMYAEVRRLGDALASRTPADHVFCRYWAGWDHSAQSIQALVDNPSARPHWIHLLLWLPRGRAWRALIRQHRRLSAQQQRIAARRQRMSSMATHCGTDLIDEDFFERSHDEQQIATPWLSGALQARREELFVAAMALHKAFVDVAAQKLLHNLSVLTGVMNAGSFGDPAKDRHLSALWSSLFLVVPVVSTTFASVQRMLGKLPPESIGWLLVDEAGQATPSHAVGAVMRARRAVFVGDPIQIPPVETLPERLIVELCAHYRQDRDAWAAPVASAQTLADRASRFRSSFTTDSGDRAVGVPLLVHRRCENPMFSISNELAYNNLMVQRVTPTDGGEIRLQLGPARWFSVDGRASGHWCEREGERLVALLQTLAGAGVQAPDLFIVTPFRQVRIQMQARLRREVALFQTLGLDLEPFVREHVGTVHTVQGRDADTVIFLLGAPESNQAGARRWAGSPENLVNVAVSRAKRNFYVIGSHGAWSGVGSFTTLANYLPVDTSERRDGTATGLR